MFGCKHEWIEVSKEVTESKFEVAMRASGSGRAAKRVTIPWQMCDASRKVIIILSCKKCGKLNKFVEQI